MKPATATMEEIDKVASIASVSSEQTPTLLPKEEKEVEEEKPDNPISEAVPALLDPENKKETLRKHLFEEMTLVRKT